MERPRRRVGQNRPGGPEPSPADWAAAVEAAGDGILAVDRDEGVTVVNHRFLEMWRLAGGHGRHLELLSPVLDDLVDKEGFLRRTRAAYASPGEDSIDVVRFKDGRVFEHTSTPQRVGGEIVGRVWTCRDVSEWERLLERALFLGDAARLLSSLDIEQALAAVARLVVPRLGEACAIRVKADGQEQLIAASRDPAHPLRPAVPPAALAGRSVVYQEGGVAHLAVPLVVKGQLVGTITLAGPPGRAYGSSDRELVEALAIRVELAIENARLYRQVQQAVREREEFLSIAAHEIRGPLNAIHLAVQSIRQGKVPPEALPRLFELVERQDHRLAHFVEELLDLGRIRAGRFRMEYQDVRLSEVVQDVVARLNLELVRSRSPLDIQASHDVLGRWDRSRLDQVVSNLLSNAIKFGMGRPIELRLDEHAGYARLVVRDHGVGIEPEVLDRVFEPFERGVSVRHYGGLGLGLYIVKTIVDALGGSVRVTSEPGKGAEFTVELPRTGFPGQPDDG